MNLYLFFHLNLAFSSIAEEERPAVIDSCYWPLLELIEQQDIKAAIEITGYTLEAIQQLAPDWVNRFQYLAETGRTELIGSGYSQMIAPLAPAKVNYWNQKIGKTIYNTYGFTPKIALVNEMAYARGVVEHYIDTGYQGIIMEWNNPYLYHSDWQRQWRYFPQIVTDLQQRTIPVIWADSIAFQKFQRFAHKENDLEDYLFFIRSKKTGGEQYFPLYSNDAEIFDYRPGRFASEEKLSAESEWQRLATLFQALKSDSDYRFVLPSAVLAGVNAKEGGHHLSLEAPEQPIPVKKQEKYNINRWALTGRGDYHINTACYALYNAIKEQEDTARWQQLCYLWSSDFRTHITERRWQKFTAQLQKSVNQTKRQQTVTGQNPAQKQHLKGDRKYLAVQSTQLALTLNLHKGLAIKSLGQRDTPPLLGTLDHGFYDDITLGADFYSGHTVIETPARHKITDLNADAIYQLEETGSQTEFISTCQNAQFYQHKRITLDKKSLTIEKEISIPQRSACRIHPFHFTFIPAAWDFSTLYFATHNGGSRLEYFYFTDAKEIRHSEMLSPLISAKHALGATEGVVIIGDLYKTITFRHQPGKSAMIPRIVIQQANDGQFFFRLQYSVQEIDETFRSIKEPASFSATLEIEIDQHG